MFPQKDPARDLPIVSDEERKKQIQIAKENLERQKRSNQVIDEARSQRNQNRPGT